MSCLARAGFTLTGRVNFGGPAGMWDGVPDAFSDAVDEAGVAIAPAVARQFKDRISRLAERVKPI